MDHRLSEYLIEHASEIILIFSEAGYVDYANRAAYDLLEYDSFEGVGIWDVMPIQFAKAEIGFDAETEFSDEPQSVMAYRKNKTCFRCDAKLQKTNTDRIGYVAILEDASKSDFLEKKIVQVEEEAKAALKVKSEFVANVTHELRTPVNGILGNTRIMIEQEEDEKKLGTLNLIERGCNDMHSIINNILDFSKLEAGKFTLENREFEFRPMIDYVKSNHMPKVTEKGLQFFITVSPEIPTHIIGDELRITQVLNNLLSNATKFTSFGKISVEILKTAQVGKRIELFFMVVDTGIGMDKNDQDKLFKSFSQVDASISRKYGGTGLGLNISQQLVQLMNGNISVESEKNKGTAFSFNIWVEVPEAEIGDASHVDSFHKIDLAANNEEAATCFGSEDNLTELDNKLSKLILSVEMENWEKAENFVEAVRQLTVDAPKEVRTAVLKLKMSVQKGDYDKVMEAHTMLREVLEQKEWNNE